jgi:hypothetical protein
MALNFPNSPTIGDEFTGGGFTWVWTGDSWDKVMAATTGGNGFSLIVGSSGNTTYAFEAPQPAGAYSFTSELGDTTFDIYLVTADNQNAGYANANTALEATADFTRAVIYGATNNDIINFDYKPAASPATSGDVADGAAPFLTSATPAVLASIDATTTVTGGNFATDVEIAFTGQDAVARAAKDIVRSSSTSLIVTRPDDFPVSQEPYTMTATNAGIVNPSTNVNKLVNYFDAGSGIVWVTTSPLPGSTVDGNYDVTLLATDADGTSVGYALISGSLPAGLSLDGLTGQISGVATTVGTSTFTVRATDAGGNFADREFSITVALAITVDYLVLAGGAGGGTVGGGGGAGGYRTSAGTSGGNTSALAPFTLASGTNYTVTVGAGGAGYSGGSGGPGGAGSNSVFHTVTATGGGGGAGLDVIGGTGGSGGGTRNMSGAGTVGGSTAGSSGAGTTGQGFAGGTNFGGGGGAGQAGSIGPAGGSPGGKGGDGISSSITGTATFRAGGGGGGTVNGTNGAGGAGGGAGGGGPTGASAAANTGGGGGGSTFASNQAFPSGSGGSGVVIIRYPSANTLNVGAGLSANAPITVGANKVTVITSGTGTVSLS